MAVIAITEEFDAGLYYKRAQVLDQLYGDSGYHRQPKTEPYKVKLIRLSSESGQNNVIAPRRFQADLRDHNIARIVALLCRSAFGL